MRWMREEKIIILDLQIFSRFWVPWLWLVINFSIRTVENICLYRSVSPEWREFFLKIILNKINWTSKPYAKQGSVNADERAKRERALVRRLRWDYQAATGHVNLHGISLYLWWLMQLRRRRRHNWNYSWRNVCSKVQDELWMHERTNWECV